MNDRYFLNLYKRYNCTLHKIFVILLSFMNWIKNSSNYNNDVNLATRFSFYKNSIILPEPQFS